MNDNSKTIPVLESTPLRKGPRVVVGVLDARTLIEQHFVPRRDTRTKTGYQRDLTQSRVNRLENELRARRVDLPTAVLLSMRDDSNALLEDDQKGLHLRLAGRSLNVVDGQHRIASLRRLVDGDPERWSAFKVPFVCVLGANEHQEMEQFYVVNSTAKSVRTDLAYDLLKQQAESDPALAESLEERGEKWKVVGQTVVERLGEESNPWRSRIRFPGEPVGATMIHNSAMVNSLKQLLASPYFSNVTTDNQVKILDAYWHGVQAVLAECFERPTEYAIQKSTGVMTMHVLLVSVIEHVRSAGDSVIEPGSYERVLETPLTQMQGENPEGDVARGSEFWRVGSAGAAGSFSSNAGRRVLLAKIRSRLPKIEIE